MVVLAVTAAVVADIPLPKKSVNSAAAPPKSLGFACSKPAAAGEAIARVELLDDA